MVECMHSPTAYAGNVPHQSGVCIQGIDGPPETALNLNQGSFSSHSYYPDLRKPPRAIFAVNLHVDLLVNLLQNHIFTSQFTSKFMTKLVLLVNLYVNLPVNCL